MSDEEYHKSLDMKLNEEVAEYYTDKNIEELADILEVIYAITSSKGYSVADLEKIRLDKAQKRGGFEKRMLLVEVDKK